MLLKYTITDSQYARFQRVGELMGAAIVSLIEGAYQVTHVADVLAAVNLQKVTS